MAALQGERAPAEGADTASGLNRKDRFFVIAAALMALFLGALDTLVMEAAMPTIVADMGRLELYSWILSVYLLRRAVALPIFGKLADLYSGKHLFGFAIAIGVGIFGSLLNARFIGTLSESGLGGSLPPAIGEQIRQNIEQIFRPNIQSLISVDALKALQETVGRGVSMVLWASAVASLLCLISCLSLPLRKGISPS